MSWLKKFVFSHFYTTILVVLVALTASFVILSFQFDSHSIASELFINLAASSAFALITIFGIEYLRESKRQLEIIDGEKAAGFDAARISRMLIWWIGGPLGENSFEYKVDSKNKSYSEDKNARVCINKLRALDLESKITNLPPDKWDQIVQNFNLLKEQVDDFAKYYSDVTPRSVYSKYLSARRLHAAILRSFAPSPFTDILTKAEKNWPPNKFGHQYNLEIRKELISQFVSILKDYLRAIDEFHEMVARWTSRSGIKYE